MAGLREDPVRDRRQYGGQVLMRRIIYSLMAVYLAENETSVQKDP